MSEGAASGAVGATLGRRFTDSARLMSPLVAFPAVWTAGLLLAQIHVLNFQTSWSATTWLVMAAVPIAFVCGGLIASSLVASLAIKASAMPTAASSPRLRKLMVACIAIGFLEVLHQSVISGSVPLLSASIDQARVGQAGGPSILLLELMTAAIIVAFTLPERLTAREARFEIGVCLAGLAVFALEGGRSALILPLAAAVLARFMYWGMPRPRVVLAAVLVLITAVSAVFFVRTAQEPSESFQVEFYNEVLPGSPAVVVPLLPVDIAIVTNYQALAAIVDHFPDQEPFAGGRFDERALDRFIHGTRSIGDTSAQLTPPWVTSTAAGPFWGDGGLSVVVIGMALIGLISTAAYRYFRSTHDFRHALIAGLLLYMALFGVYANLFTAYVNWLLDIPLLLALGAIAQNPAAPPGFAGRVDGWAREARDRTITASSRVRGLLSGPRATVVGALIVILALVVIGSQIKNDSPTGGLQVGAPLPVEGPAPLRGVRLATDGNLPSDNLPLWWLNLGGSTLHELSPGERHGSVHQIRQVPIARLSPGESFDVSTWGRAGASAVFRMRPLGDRVRVAVTRPGSGAATAGGTAVLPPPSAGATRNVAIATWTGEEPDLFVIDRGLDDQRVEIRVFSGESRFRREILDVRAPIAGLNPWEWSLDVASVVGPARREDQRPDLVLVRRDGSSGQPEVHVLSGESDFQQFQLERVIAMPETIESKSEFAVGAVLGAPTIYALEPGPPGAAKLRLIMLQGAVTPI